VLPDDIIRERQVVFWNRFVSGVAISPSASHRGRVALFARLSIDPLDRIHIFAAPEEGPEESDLLVDRRFRVDRREFGSIGKEYAFRLHSRGLRFIQRQSKHTLQTGILLPQPPALTADFIKLVTENFH
jgi:hypothetical protein